MQVELWKRIETLYQAALAQPIEQRAAFLLHSCPDDPQLRSEVQSLLDQQADSFLEGSPLPSLVNQSDFEDPFRTKPIADQFVETGNSPGDRIGPYKLLAVIGQGGMGQVWLAEQQTPILRRVAIKLIKVGMDTREVIARFESERQALALMDHPAIAKVFDAGSTPQGRPYFVMEYVDGIPITDYCDKHLLTVRQRLELFIQVCQGVQHAHQKALIHRDLKPSNILVCEIDGRPIPRIIDFGVAKAISQRLSAQSMYTRVGTLVGTVGYMSPEQADTTSEDIDTRSDVYSLGVLLYELLVGTLPFDPRKLAFDEVLRRLREDDSPKPSSKLRSLGPSSAAAAQRRGAEPASLIRQFRGDLDAIVLKAVDRVRERRYATPLDLAADIGRYQRHEPVTAHAPSLGYRVSKYVQRHRVGVAVAVAFVLVLIAAGTFSIRQSIRANREAAAAQAVNDFLQNDLLAQASAAIQSGPNAKPDPHLEVRTALDRAAARIGGKFNHQPEVEATIRETIGQTYVDLGLYPNAEAQLQQALALHRQVFGDNDPNTLKTISQLGEMTLLQGNYPKAEALLAKTSELQRKILGPESPDTLESTNGLATAYEHEGKYTQAEPLFRQTLAIRRRLLGPDHRATLASMNDLAVTYAEQGKYAQVEPLFRQILDRDSRVLGPEHPDTLRALDNLANIYAAEGKYSQAEAPYRQATETKRRILGIEHPETLRSMGNLAVVYEGEGKYSEAETLQSQILDVSRRVLGPEHPETLRAMGNLAETNDQDGKYGKAESLFSQVLEMERRVLGAEHPNTLETLSEFAWMCQRQQKYSLAQTEGARVLASRRRVLGSDHPDTMNSAANLALAYLSDGKFAQSEPLAREVLAFNNNNQPDDWQRFRAETLVGESLAGQKRYAEAEPLLLDGYQGMLGRKDRIDVPDWYHIQRAREWIIQLYRDWDKPQKAADWREK